MTAFFQASLMKSSSERTSAARRMRTHQWLGAHAGEWHILL